MKDRTEPLDNARRLGELEHAHAILGQLLAHERLSPGSVDDGLVQGLHHSVTSWCRMRGVEVK